MEKDFFLNRTFFWSFWTNILFILGITGYLLMDIHDYNHSNIFHLYLTNSIYIALASVFVVSSTLQFLVIYRMNRDTPRYYTMILSCLFDKIGSHAYLIGAILTTISWSNISTIWTFNAVGVCAFVVGAVINMLIPATSSMSLWADYFNLLGSLFYLLSIMLIRMPFAQLTVIAGDVIYLIDAFLYLVCWFEDRRWMIKQHQHYLLFR